MPVKPLFKGQPAIILGTGPSLSKQIKDILQMQKKGFKLFGINNTFDDFDLDVWIACDPQWHDHYSPISGDFDKWHWDKGICEKYGYAYVEGRWGDGLSVDSSYIHYNHSSGAQALNLAVLYGCDPIYLCGFDMKYDKNRHYFTNLSKDLGEYPEKLRKYSTFDGLIGFYDKMAAQVGLPRIYNATLGSALKSFEFRSL